MAHRTLQPGYTRLVERINRFPQGAPPSEVLYAILTLLFSEREAELVALLPLRPFNLKRAAKAWHMEEKQARPILDELASRTVLLDTQRPDGEVVYILPPPMAGFFEFSLMRLRSDLDQKLLAELFYQYLNVEDEFVSSLFAPTGTALGRVFVQEPSLPKDNHLYILDYERASDVIRSASHRSVGLCYCRHKLSHVGKACSAALDICMTFNNLAETLSRHKVARLVSVEEGLDLLQQAYELNLVQCGENVRNRVSFICNCCGCCCEALVAARRFTFLTPVATTNFIPHIQTEQCSGCGQCVDVCPVEAMSLVSASDPHKPRRREARLDEERCLGCGVCVRSCSKNALRLELRAQRVITPVDSVHRVVRMAIERGSLQNLVFDNQALTSHRALAAVLGAILRLPPLQQALASEQFKSRYLEKLISWGEKMVC
jgi:formate hydrogenlyase subunit 6/NADH:ubiquinone oxidoreductase subunit I